MDHKELKKTSQGLRQMPLKQDLVYRNFVKDLKQSKKNNKTVNLAVLSCPDYSFKVDKSGWGEYTHKKLGYGPGMLTLAYSKAFLQVSKDVNRANSNLNVFLFYGDIEGSDEDILKQVRLTKTEFHDRLLCNISSGKLHLESLMGNKNNIRIKSLGMEKTIYSKKVMILARKKLTKITNKDLQSVAKNRKKVIESLYGLKYLRDKKLFDDKINNQILDRLVVGTYFDLQIEKRQKWYLLSIIPESLIKYVNFRNRNQVPLLQLGS